MTTPALLLILAIAIPAFLAGKLSEAWRHERALRRQQKPVTAADLRRLLGERHPFWRRLVMIKPERLVDVGLTLAAILVLAPILYVGWVRPVTAPHPVGKFVLHAGTVGVRTAAGEVRP